MKGDAHRPEVVHGLRASGGLADFLHGRDQQTNQDRDDGNDHQQLDQGEASPRAMRTENDT